MLPSFWQLFHGVWLGAGAFESLRSIAFFGGEGLGRWMLQLGLWTVASALLLALVALRERRRPAGAAPAGTAQEPGTGNRADARPDHEDEATGGTRQVLSPAQA